MRVRFQSLFAAALVCLMVLANTPISTRAQENPTPEATVEATGTIPAQPLEVATTEATTAPTEEITSTPDLTETAKATETVAPTGTSDPTEEATDAPSATETEEAVDPGTPTFSTAAVQTLNIHTVDQNSDPVLGASYDAYVDLGGGTVGGYLGSASDSSPSDGTATFTGLPAGTAIAIIQRTVPRGYIAKTELIYVTLTSGETRTVDVSSPLGGKITVFGKDEHQQPLLGACYTAYIDNSGSRGANAGGGCDNFNGATNDGTTLIEALPAGSYLIAPFSQQNTDYAPGPDIAVTIQLAETKEITSTFVPKGTIVIHSRDKEGDPLPGTCFTVFVDQGNGQHDQEAHGGGCDYADGHDDGEITFRAIGKIVIGETQVPYGYVAPEEILVEIATGETKTFTVETPLASVLDVAVTDLWGTPVYSTCLRLSLKNEDGTAGNYYGEECTPNFGANRHHILFDLLPPADYVLTIVNTADGYYHDGLVPVTVGLSETKQFNLELNGPKPVLNAGPLIGWITQTEALIYWETDQPTEGVVDYGLSASLGRVSARDTTETKAHRIKLQRLRAGTVYYFKIAGENPNGEYESDLYTFQTPISGATSRVVVTKTNSDGSKKLGGACFLVYEDAGNGVPGDIASGGCDKFDVVSNDGKIEITGLFAGNYVLVESLSPAGYSLAKNVLFSVTPGQTKQVTVKDTKGGAVLTVSAELEHGSSDLIPVLGACFAVYAKVNGGVGALVSQSCDEFDGNDGLTRLGALKAGSYYLQMTYTPVGVLPGQAYYEIRIASGARTAEFRQGLMAENDPGNIIVQAVDGDGNLLAGACFALYQVTSGEDPFLSSACDSDDNHYDGRTIFRSYPANRYTVQEYFAPFGYQVGTKVSFTKVDNAVRNLKVVQVKGGAKLKVTTVKGATTSKLGGACYGLFMSTGSQQFVTGACDSNGDGIVEIVGVPAGTYILAQTQTPSGYRRPAERTITVSRSASFTFKTFQR